MNEECSICLTKQIIPMNKCITQCNHTFCKECLDMWFDNGKNTCPICRHIIKYFDYNGIETRIISIKNVVTIPQLPTLPTPPLQNNTHIRLKKGEYYFIVFSLYGLLMTNFMTFILLIET